VSSKARHLGNLFYSGKGKIRKFETVLFSLKALLFNGQLLDSCCTVSEKVALILVNSILVITKKRK